MIPEGWKQELANDLCSQISVGIVVKPAAYYVDEACGIRTFRSANVGEGFVKDRDWIYISEEGHRVNRKSVLQTNDVLIVRTGYPGTACLVPPEYAGSNCIDIIFARPKPDRIVPSYLCVFTNSEYGKKQVLDGQGGLAQQHFNVGAFKEIRIPLPPIHEQRRITEILLAWDRAIETVEALIANARAQKQALMHSLLTGKKRLAGFSTEWIQTPIAKMGTIVSGGTPDSTDPTCWGGDIAWATPTDITKLRTRHISQTERYITPFGLSSSSAKRLPVETVIVCTRATVGALAIATVPMTTNQGFKNIVPNAKHDSDFIYFLMSQNKKALIRAAGGSTFAEVSKADFEKLTFSVPRLDEQQAIAAVLICADTACEKLERKLTALREEKSALMQQLLTGKRRVKLDEKENA